MSDGQRIEIILMTTGWTTYCDKNLHEYRGASMERRHSWTHILIGSIALVALMVVGASRLHGEGTDTELISTSQGQSFYYRLDVADQYGFYDDCSGLGSSTDVEEAVVETDAGVVVRQKTPGPLQWHNITLRRTGPTPATGVPVWAWRKAMEDGNLEYAIQNGVITLWTADSTEAIARWEFRNGWVASLSFDGAIEELTIVHEGLTRTGIIDTEPTPRSR